jgi:hypothetical protein
LFPQTFGAIFITDGEKQELGQHEGNQKAGEEL